MGSGKALGLASDFFRLRLVRLDEGDTPDLDWRDDILYRDPPIERLEERDAWVIEVVDITDDTVASTWGLFQTPEQARALLDVAEPDLEEMTRSQFEARYFPAE